LPRGPVSLTATRPSRHRAPRSAEASSLREGLIFSRRRPTSADDLKPRLAESFAEAGKDIAVVAFRADFVFPALDQNVSLEQVIDASNYHGRRSISSSSQSKTTSTGIRVSVTHQTISLAGGD
jgi:hypothetical protein